MSLGKFTWKLLIDPQVIEVIRHEKIGQSYTDIWFHNPPKEIINTIEWYDDACDFSEDGNIRIGFNHDTKSLSPLPDFVGFFEIPENVNVIIDRENYKFKYLSDKSEIRKHYNLDLPKFGLLYIPIPVKCIVRNMNAEEKLILSNYEGMTQRERAHEDECMMQARKKLIQNKPRGKDGGRTPDDGQENIDMAVAKVLELRDYNKSRSMTMEHACKIAIKELPLIIKWQALAKQVRKSPKWKILKKRIIIARK